MMAQRGDIQRISSTPNDQRVQNSSNFKGSKAQTPPTFQQLLQCDNSKWSYISSQLKKKNHDQDNDAKRHTKKSVLDKVKEKAKKLKLTLRGKKHSDTNESRRPTTRSSDVGPKDKSEEDTEYHCAQMIESKFNPPTKTQVLVSSSGKHLDQKPNTKQIKDEHASFTAPSDPSVDTDTKIQTSTTKDDPKLHEFPQINSRLSTLTVSTPESSNTKSDTSVQHVEIMKHESQTRDKGIVTVKEYLMQKFEPGEDERALSKAITQTISPRRDKVREAMSSFLKNEESSEVMNSSNVDNNVDLKSKSLPTSTNTRSKTAPIKQSYSLGSNASKASLSLNQTFKSTFASYQDHFINSSSKPSSSANTKPSSSPTIETQAPRDTKKSRVPSHTATSVRRVPVSRSNQKWASIHTHASATRTPLSTGDQGRFRV